MKASLLHSLRCLACSQNSWQLDIQFQDSREIREGMVSCTACGKRYPISGGILQMLEENLSEEIAHEKEHAESFDYLVTQEGEKHPINRETFETFRHVFLSLPGGDGSHFFKPGGSRTVRST